MAFAGGMINQRDGGGGSPSGNLNKRTPRGSLWLPSLETVQVCHVALQHSQLFLFLIRLDEELAAQAQGAGCSCGGVLHRANYPSQAPWLPDPRDPRGVLVPVEFFRQPLSPTHDLDIGAFPGPARVSKLGGGAKTSCRRRCGRRCAPASCPRCRPSGCRAICSRALAVRPPRPGPSHSKVITDESRAFSYA